MSSLSFCSPFQNVRKEFLHEDLTNIVARESNWLATIQDNKISMFEFYSSIRGLFSVGELFYRSITLQMLKFIQNESGEDGLCEAYHKLLIPTPSTKDWADIVPTKFTTFLISSITKRAELILKKEYEACFNTLSTDNI